MWSTLARILGVLEVGLAELEEEVERLKDF